jgi:copper homeostasis protein
MPFQLEICCYNFLSCRLAEAAGAHRIELCANPADGGTTPSWGMIKAVKKSLHIPVYPIIRPRGGDFLFSHDEFEIMKTDVLLCKESGCEGVVIGMLQADGSINKKKCALLVELAYPLEVTFHRSFDRALNPFEALEDIIDIGCTRLLTSGQHPLAEEGTKLINELIKQANNRIIVMPGAGIRTENIIRIAENTGATEFHSSASVILPGTAISVNHFIKETPFELSVNKVEVENMIRALQHFFEPAS